MAENPHSPGIGAPTPAKGDGDDGHQEEALPCEKCDGRFPATSPVCPFCNHRRPVPDGGSPGTLTQGVGKPDASEPKVPDSPPKKTMLGVTPGRGTYAPSDSPAGQPSADAVDHTHGWEDAGQGQKNPGESSVGARGSTGDTVADAPSAWVTATRDPASSEHLAQAQILLENTCPSCGDARLLERILVEGWEDTGYSLTGKHTWTVRSREIAGYCGPCGRGLFFRRILATLLLGLPLWFLLAAGTAFGGKGALILGVLYGLHVLSRISYSWADWLLYGAELEIHLAGRLGGVSANAAAMKFPFGCLASVLRLGFIVGMGVVAIFLGGIWHDTRADEGMNGPVSRETGRHSASLEEAMQSGDLAGVKAFLAADPARVQQRNAKGETLLHRAVETDQGDLIALLAGLGADLEAKDKAPGSTPLHRAAIFGKMHAALALLKAGAKVDSTRTVDRITPLQLATLSDQEMVVKVLLAGGADARKPLPGGTSLLEAARKSNARKVLRLLEPSGRRKP